VQAWRRHLRERAEERFVERFSPRLFADVVCSVYQDDIGPLLSEAVGLCGFSSAGSGKTYFTAVEYEFLAAFCDDVPGSKEE